jgi:hypothetical protein
VKIILSPYFKICPIKDSFDFNATGQISLMQQVAEKNASRSQQ